MNDRDIFFKHLAPTSHQPVGLEVTSASGSVITDISGKTYYDLIAGIGVASLGHQHPAINDAIKQQMKRHAHVMVYGEYIQQPVNQLAKSLSDLLPKPLNTCYFVNSGTEANEGAIKLTKRVTGRHKIVAFRKGYHGNTQGSMSVSANEQKKQPYRPLIPGITFLEFNKQEDLSKIDRHTAGVIIEPIQGDAGVIIPDAEFMMKLRNRCTKTGAQLIFDEVQTGIGRTGKMFAFEHFGCAPDIITLAKGLGGGLPIGAFISSYDNMQQLATNPMLGHITTFGGNPLCCAAANAVLKTITREDFLTNVEAKGAQFESLLSHPEVKEIRRKGLMLAIELENEEKVNKAIELCLEKGVIIYWFLSTRNAFRISPPLNISDNDIEESCKRLNGVFDAL